MADKIINIRIDVSKINKGWLFKGEKGTYLDATVFYNEEQDEYESNGMIVQSVPKAIRDKDDSEGKKGKERTRGEILGNCREFKKGGSRESVPGSENESSKGKGSKAAAAQTDEDVADDLPF